LPIDRKRELGEKSAADTECSGVPDVGQFANTEEESVWTTRRASFVACEAATSIWESGLKRRVETGVVRFMIPLRDAGLISPAGPRVMESHEEVS